MMICYSIASGDGTSRALCLLGLGVLFASVSG